jgi:hypothetical protein
MLITCILNFLDERRIILNNSWVHHHVTSTLEYITYIQKLIFDHLYYTHAMNSSKSQNQTCMTLRMDDRIGKNSVKDLRTNVQQTMANIPVGGVKNLLLSHVFLLLSAIEE